MTLDLLGRGWRYPIAFQNQRVALVDGGDAVQQSIWIILGTAPGERVMRPDFGCGLHSLVFANASASVLSEAEGHVREALLRWEPRIDLTEVRVTADVDVAARLLIQVSYRLRATQQAFNLVYPFYLEA